MNRPSHTASFGVLLHQDVIIDEVLVTLFKAPGSYTGQDSVEVSCHGSVFIQQQLLQLLQSNFPGVRVNKKLEQWPSLSFAEFLKELGKQKIKPALPQQAEWMGYFEIQKTKALTLQTVIDTTDKEIDAMVYALYGLTNEEIQLVEGSG